MENQNSTPAPKVKLTIGTPENYVSKKLEADGKTRKIRVAYLVSGSKEAIDQYNQDLVDATGAVSQDKVTGKPLFTLSIEKFSKLSGTIERSVRADGTVGWFIDNSEEQLMDKIMSGKSPEELRDYNSDKRAEISANLKAMLASKASKVVVITENQEKL
jgi:hypothetical protein